MRSPERTDTTPFCTPSSTFWPFDILGIADRFEGLKCSSLIISSGIQDFSKGNIT
jgi:hypothetical protein